MLIEMGLLICGGHLVNIVALFLSTGANSMSEMEASLRNCRTNAVYLPVQRGSWRNWPAGKRLFNQPSTLSVEWARRA